MSKICDAIKYDNNIKKILNDIIHESSIDEKEHLVKFCSDNDKIVLSESCRGGKYRVSHEKTCSVSCPPGTKEVGEFHTHPSEAPYLSKIDIFRQIELDFKTGCIGYEEATSPKFYSRIVKCFDYPFGMDINNVNILKSNLNKVHKKHKEFSDRYYELMDIKTSDYKENVTKKQKNELESIFKSYELANKELSKTIRKIKKNIKEEKVKESCIETVGKEEFKRWK